MTIAGEPPRGSSIVTAAVTEVGGAPFDEDEKDAHALPALVRAGGTKGRR